MHLLDFRLPEVAFREMTPETSSDGIKLVEASTRGAEYSEKNVFIRVTYHIGRQKFQAWFVDTLTIDNETGTRFSLAQIIRNLDIVQHSELIN